MTTIKIAMGKIIIDNVPNSVLSEMEHFLQAIITDDAKPMLEDAGYSEQEHMTKSWNVYSHPENVESGFYYSHVVWGGMIHPVERVAVDDEKVVVIASETLKEAMGDPDIWGATQFQIDDKIYFYIDHETWETRENMSNEDWLEYLKNQIS